MDAHICDQGHGAKHATSYQVPLENRDIETVEGADWRGGNLVGLGKHSPAAPGDKECNYL